MTLMCLAKKKNDDYKEKDKLRIVVSEVSSFVGSLVQQMTLFLYDQQWLIKIF